MTSPLSYSAGTAFLTVVPSFRNIQRELGEIAEQIGRRVDRAMVDQLPRSMRNAVRGGADAGRDYGRRFGENAEREIRAAMNRIPAIRIPTTEAERRIRNVRRELAALRPARVGIDFDDRTFLRRLHAAQRELDDLIGDEQTIHVRAELEQARDQIRRFIANDLIEQSQRAGSRAGGEFGRLFGDRVRRAAGAVEIEPRFDMSGAEFRLFQLSQRLRALGNVTIGVDMDAGQAIAQLRALQAQLAWLALNSPDVEIRTNAAKAAAELMAIIQLAHRIDGMDVDVDTDRAGAAMRRLGQSTDIPIHRLGVLIALGLSIGPILVPMAAAAAVAIGGIATAALAAVSGVGVLVLALSGVFKAVQALHKYQQDADKSAKSLSASQTAVANAADSVRSAERSLANTRASVAAANRRAARAVAEAQESVADAVRDRKRAEDDLVEAIKAAHRADEDRRRSIRANALDIRQANLDIAEAKRELDAVLANPRATDEERERAQIAYEQRVLQLEDLQSRQKDLAEEQAKWNKEGAAGTDGVKTAQERLRSATERVADANERVAAAVEAQQETQRNGQYQLEQATQSLVSAQRSLQQATVNAGVAGGEALDNLRDAMEALSPAGQRFAQFIYGLKDEFRALRAASEEALLPGLQRGLESLLRYMPGLTDFISRLGTAVGDSFAWAVEQLQHPEWQRFFRHISETAVPAWQGLIRFGEAFARGLASLIVSLSAFNGSMGRGLIEWAEGFARWAEELENSQGFRRFLDYVKEAGPDVLRFLGELWEFAKRLLIAWAPVGSFMLKILTGILAGINALPLGALTVFLSIVAGISAAMLLFKGAGVLWRAVAGTFATGARLVTGAFGAMRTVITGNTTSSTRMSRVLVQLHRGFAALGPPITSAARAAAGFFAATATGARVTALLAATSAISAYRAAVSRLAAVFGPAATRVGSFFSAATTRAQAAAMAVGATALGAYRGAVSRLSGVLSTAATRMGSFFAATATGARVTALLAATSAVGLYRTAIARMSTILPAAGARMSTFMTAATSRVATIAAAARSMGTYRAAVGALATALVPVTLRSGTFFSTLRLGSTATGAASAATRLLGRAWLDTRIILASATLSVQRWYTATSLAATASAVWARTSALLSPVLTRINAAASVVGGSISRMAAALTLSGLSGSGARGSLTILSGVLGGFASAAGRAALAAGRFATSLASLGVAAAGRTMGALSSLASFLGGPWGIALTIATLGITALIVSSQRAKNKFKELRDGLQGFADVFDDGFTPAAYDSAEAMLRQDGNLRRLIGSLRAAGFDTKQIVSAINGEEQARESISRALDEQIRHELHLAAVARQGADHETAASKVHSDRAKNLGEMKAAMEGASVASQRAREIAEDLRIQDVATADEQRRLNEAFRDGARAADILRQAYKSLYGDAQSREEALDAERAAYDRLRASVEKNGATLDVNTEAGRENRQNMRDRIQALADLAAADVAATGTISEDTQKRIDKLKQELTQMGFNEEEIDKMIKIYMGVPPKILTEIILNGGANAQGVLNETGKKALEMIATYNLSPSEAMIIAKGGIPPGWRGPSPSALAQAEGGYIRGPGTTTSDSIPALLSDEEFVEPAHAVRHYGPQVFEAMRHHRIPKEHLAGFARGGIVDASGVRRFALGGYTGERGSAKADVMGIRSWGELRHYADKLWKEKAAELEAWATAQAGSSTDFGAGPGFPPWPSSPGASRGDSGVWRSIVRLIRSTGPVSGSFGNAYRHRDPLWHGCVPMDTLVLTRRGWVHFADIRVGEDETVGYNPATGRSEWTRIVGMHRFRDAELWTIESGDWRAEVTPGHRWLTDDGLLETRRFTDETQVRVATLLAPDAGGSIGAGLVNTDARVTEVRRVASRNADVFCPATVLGTWTAKQGDRIFLTGNSGRAVDWMGFNQDALAEFLAARRPLELIHRTNKRDYAYTRGRNRGSFSQRLMNDHRNHIHIAMKLGGLVKRDIRRSLMDSGGWLEPGMNAIYNGLRQPEAVLTPTQSAALVQLAQSATSGVGPRTVNNFTFRDTTLDTSRLAAINRAEEVYDRVGRSR